MTAHTARSASKQGYYHIYNKGVADKVIFRNEADYQVFLGYLNDYLTPPNPGVRKKEFTVKGRSYKGVPHQPKNYYNKIELICFSLNPNRFHLLIHQLEGDAIEKFVRSLCTRYSMYYNKKYHRTGSLFDRPYKSAYVKDLRELLYLSRYLHRISIEENLDTNYSKSSYQDFLVGKTSPLASPQKIISYFDQISKSPNSPSNYKDFVERYTTDQKEDDLLKDMIPMGQGWKYRIRPEIKLPLPTPPKQADVTIRSEPASRLQEILVVSFMFFVLLGLGVRNITMASSNSANQALSTPMSLANQQTLGVQTEVAKTPKPKATPTETPTPATSAAAFLVVKVTDTGKSVNIRQAPDISSKIVAKAKDGDEFEIVSAKPDWYEIKINEKETGFISSAFAEQKN